MSLRISAVLHPDSEQLFPCLFISLSCITGSVFPFLQILLLKNKYFSSAYIFSIFIFGELWYNIKLSSTETDVMCKHSSKEWMVCWSKNESMNEGYEVGGKEINLIELDFVKWHESRSPLIHVSRKFYLLVKGAIFALFSNWQIKNYTAWGLELSQI